MTNNNSSRQSTGTQSIYFEERSEEEFDEEMFGFMFDFVCCGRLSPTGQTIIKEQEHSPTVQHTHTPQHTAHISERESKSQSFLASKRVLFGLTDEGKTIHISYTSRHYVKSPHTQIYITAK